MLKPRGKYAPCILHLSRSHGDRWGAMDLAIPSIWFCFQILLGRRKTSTLSTQRYCSPTEGGGIKNTYLGLTTMIERAKQELLSLSYRWVSPQNVEYYTKYECKGKSFPTENQNYRFSA